ncbi:hypothetical protein C9988_04210, partial [Pseudidiomarina aestuarii]
MRPNSDSLWLDGDQFAADIWAPIAARSDAVYGYSPHFVVLDPTGLVGGDSAHSYSLTTESGAIEFRWGYWEPGSYMIKSYDPNYRLEWSYDVENASSLPYHFVWSNVDGPSVLPDSGIRSFEFAAGGSLLANDQSGSIDLIDGNIAIDFGQESVFVTLLFDVGEATESLQGSSSIWSLLNDSEYGFSLYGYGEIISSGVMYASLVGEDLEALAALLRVFGYNDAFVGAAVFSASDSLGQSLAAMGAVNGGMLGLNDNISIFSNAQNTAVIGTTLAQAQSENWLFQLLQLPQYMGSESEWYVYDSSGNVAASVFSGWVSAGGYALFEQINAAGDAQSQSTDNTSPFYYSYTDVLTDLNTLAIAGVHSWRPNSSLYFTDDSLGGGFIASTDGFLTVNFDTGEVAISLDFKQYDAFELPLGAGRLWTQVLFA